MNRKQIDVHELVLVTKGFTEFALSTESVDIVHIRPYNIYPCTLQYNYIWIIELLIACIIEKTCS